MNLALLLGLIAFVRGTQSIVWEPTARVVALAGIEPTRETVPRLAAGDMSDLRVAPRTAIGKAEA